MAFYLKFLQTEIWCIDNFQIWMKSEAENLEMPAGVLLYGEDYQEVFGKEFAKYGSSVRFQNKL